MSRRRGVVLSDDDSTPAPSIRSRHSTSTAPTTSRSKHHVRPTEPTADLNLPPVAVLSAEEVAKIRLLETENHALTQKLTSAMAIISDAAVAVEELQVTAANQETVEQLEMSLRSLIDASQHVKHSTQALHTTSTQSESSTEPVSLHETYLKEIQSQDSEYNTKPPSQKYAQVSEFQDFKRRVWDVNHKTLPPPATWFPSSTSAPNSSDAPPDDDVVIGGEVQSLKCPITLQLLEKPVRNTNCPHVYSLEAIRQLISMDRGGKIKCPVSGCESEVSMRSVKEDKSMARRVREERERIEMEREVGGREVQEVHGDESMYFEEGVKLE